MSAQNNLRRSACLRLIRVHRSEERIFFFSLLHMHSSHLCTRRPPDIFFNKIIIKYFIRGKYSSTSRSIVIVTFQLKLYTKNPNNTLLLRIPRISTNTLSSSTRINKTPIHTSVFIQFTSDGVNIIRPR